jgi:tetratricopeptide (TPR) repeat protein
MTVIVTAGEMQVVADFMKDLTEDEEERFDRAVRAFSEEVPMRVTAEELRAFLDATGDIDMPPAYRFRWLAIKLENEEFEEGWSGLRAIYQAAAAADPSDADVLHSWGISASEWAEEWMTPGLSDREAIAGEAERVLRAALELKPRDSGVAHALGLVRYNHPARAEHRERYRSQAIEWFSRAVEWDGGNVMAQLYLAHCFHDRKDWGRAIAEYDKVDLDKLARDWPAWRAVKCREQLAQCYAYAGNRVEAVRRFTAFLDDVESWDEESLEERVDYVDELVATVTDVLEDPELLRRTRALVERLGLQRAYEELALPIRTEEGGAVLDE